MRVINAAVCVSPQLNGIQMKSLISELSRRNVFRVAITYVAFSWLLIQITETLLPLLGLSHFILQILMILLAAGFLPALVFSWVYELTPEGIKKEKDIEREKSITHITARKLDIAVVVLLVVSMSIYFFSDGG